MESQLDELEEQYVVLDKKYTNLTGVIEDQQEVEVIDNSKSVEEIGKSVRDLNATIDTISYNWNKVVPAQLTSLTPQIGFRQSRTKIAVRVQSGKNKHSRAW